METPIIISLLNEADKQTLTEPVELIDRQAVCIVSQNSVRHSKTIPSVQTSPALVLRREPPSQFSGRPPSGGTARNRFAMDRGSWASAPGFPRTRFALPCKDGSSFCHPPGDCFAADAPPPFDEPLETGGGIGTADAFDLVPFRAGGGPVAGVLFGLAPRAVRPPRNARGDLAARARRAISKSPSHDSTSLSRIALRIPRCFRR